MAADSVDSEWIRMKREMESGLDIKKFDAYPHDGASEIASTCTGFEDLEAIKSGFQEMFHCCFVALWCPSVLDGYTVGSICKGINKGKGMEKHVGLRYEYGVYGIYRQFSRMGLIVQADYDPGC